MTRLAPAGEFRRRRYPRPQPGAQGRVAHSVGLCPVLAGVGACPAVALRIAGPSSVAYTPNEPIIRVFGWHRWTLPRSDRG